MTDTDKAGTEPQAYENTDREIWREREGDFYADSVHVTKGDGLGINCGGAVFVKPLREWHRLAAQESLSKCPVYAPSQESPVCQNCGMTRSEHSVATTDKAGMPQSSPGEGLTDHLAPEDDTKAHRRCRCEFSSGGVLKKPCAFHDRLLRAAEERAEASAKDAGRIDFMQKAMLAADFGYGDPAETVLVFKWPDTPVGADLRKNIDAAKEQKRG